MNLEGKSALVTGGSRGIGRAIADCFLDLEALVYICDIDASALKAVVSDAKGLWGSVCDVGKADDIARLFEDAEKILGGFDVLVNNAGIAGPTASIDSISPEDWLFSD